MPWKSIDARKLQTYPLADRENQLDIRNIAVDPDAAPPDAGELSAALDELVGRIVTARNRGSAVMLTYGAHLVKNGCGLLVARLVEGGWITHLATQGAGIIHDWEFAYQARSSESVRDNAPRGRFGAWEETGRWLNLAALVGVAHGCGLGESFGQLIANDGLELPAPEHLARRIREAPDDPATAARADLLSAMLRHNLTAGRKDVRHPYKRYSIPACCVLHNVPMTVHPGIGYDIIINHPLYSGAAMGRGAERDARLFAATVENLDGGVYVSVGSAIMSPQVFEKAFSAANNLRQHEGRAMISGHTIAVVDIQDGGGWDWSSGEPPKDHPAYYLRFCKSFHRMGGTMQYLRGDNRMVLSQLVHRLADQSVS